MKILLTGADGQLGRELIRRSEGQLIALNRDALDITDAAGVAAALKAHRPQAVINAAAYTAVDKAEQQAGQAYAVNRDGAAHLAGACARYGVPLMHVSTDYVFDGRRTAAYREDHPAAPLGVYGASKWAGEQAVRERLALHIILRTSWVFASHGHNFVKTVLRLARERQELRIVADQHGCPTWAGDIAETLLAMAARVALCGDGSVFGTYHFCGQPVTTWHGFAQAIVAQARAYEPLPVRAVVAISTSDYPTPAVRPAYSVLNCEKLKQVFDIKAKSWKKGLQIVLNDLYSNGR